MAGFTGGFPGTARTIAPTRAAPDHPPANRLLALGTGLVDRLRDALRGRPTSREELHARRS
ncbi:hypothetical protein V6U90_18650 [Micromonospora sp. CPCC 206060]|uniref:hypothetical protein n=1 Tax=Micromonospora sp. CPCC 206060 TaxID=3122406 RepID=UPI002FEFFC2C